MHSSSENLNSLFTGIDLSLEATMQFQWLQLPSSLLSFFWLCLLVLSLFHCVIPELALKQLLLLQPAGWCRVLCSTRSSSPRCQDKTGDTVMLHYPCNTFLSTWVCESDSTHQISKAQLERDPEADLRMGPLGHPGTHLWTQPHSSAYVHALNLPFEWSSQVLIFCLKLLNYYRHA